MDNSEKLGTKDINRLLVGMSVPAVIGMLAVTVYNVVDAIFLGRFVGMEAIAGLSVTLPLMLLINNTLGQAVGIGGASIISRALGARQKDFANKVLHNLVSIIFSLNILLFVLIGFFLPELLHLFGADESIYPYAWEYAVWALPGSFCMNIFFVLVNVIRAEGNTKFSMFCQIITAIINLVLDPILIVVFDMGVKGAAVSTSLSQITAMVLTIWYYRKSKNRVLTLHLAGCIYMPKWSVVKEIFGLGAASFGRQFANSAMTIVINNALLIYGGPISIAAYGIVYRLTMFVYMPIFGINQGFMPIAGYNYGAKNYDRVLNAFKWAVIYSSIIGILAFALSLTIPRVMLSIFTTDDGLLDVAEIALQIYVAAMPFLGVQIIGSGIFQSLGKAKTAFFLAILRQIIFLIPLAIILPECFENIFGTFAIWWAFPISDILAVLVTVLTTSVLCSKIRISRKLLNS